MPDITMCQDTSCIQREKCYRFMAVPNPYRQVYFVNSPFFNGTCEFFSPIREDDEISNEIGDEASK